MISAPSTGLMSSAPTSALTWRMISATAGALQRWWEDQPTERHRERQSPNSIMSDSWYNYREMMTEHNAQDHSQMTPNWDRIRGLSGALPTEGTDWDVYQTAYRNGCRMTILEAHKAARPMLKEHEYNYRQTLCDCHRLQEMISDISRLANQAMH